MTLSINDTVLYGIEGVCRVVGKTQREYHGHKNEYYVLKPVFSEKSLYYIPTDNEKAAAKIRRILSTEEIYSLIRSVPEEETLWIENKSQRKEAFRRILVSGNRHKLLCMLRTLYLKEQEKKSAGKHLYLSDERIMREAEKIIYEEFAHVLDIRPEQVLPFILKQVEINEREPSL